MERIPQLENRQAFKCSKHRHESFVVEKVAGGVIYTSWDREEALQFTNRLILTGRETKNSIAIRRILRSKLIPPVTETGSIIDKNHPARNIGKDIPKCSSNSFSTLGYCVEKLPVPYDTDLSSITRRRYGNHLIVQITTRGGWDEIHQRYLGKPVIFEIWHPADETSNSCTFGHYLVMNRTYQ